MEPVGRSAVMEQLRQQVRRLAQHDAHAVFSGEPGSGKETFARYLHAHSARHDQPFVDVAVAALTPEHCLAAFFGKEESGEIQAGLLEQAQGGVLFLDEVADLEADTQLRLFGALESGAFQRVGGSAAVPLDVRVIAATRKSLEQEVQAGRFRKDLYYLLNVVSLDIPPLHQHPEDVTELLNFYTDYFVTREKLAFRRFPVAVQNLLRNHPWRGNVRELKNLVQRLLILGNGEEVGLDEVKAALGSGAGPAASPGYALELFNLP